MDYQMVAKMLVTKRNGGTEQLDMAKANRVIEWACHGIAGVSPSDIAMKAVPKMYEGMPTTEIHLSFIQAAEDLIPTDYHYAEVQARLLLIDLYKNVYGDWDVIKPLAQVVQENTQRGFYDGELFGRYSVEEWAAIEKMIDHKRDYDLKGAAVKQLKDKYLTQDRANKLIYETPQVAYMLCTVAGLVNYKSGAERLAQIKKTYDAFSRQKISLPTPVFAGVRQQNKQYASCVLIDVDDSLDSINEACTTANLYAAKRAGLGINIGRLRPEGSRVGAGEVVHTGIVPFIRQFESSIKSCSQGGIRDASATLFLPIWHAEIEKVMVLKSPKVSEENAVRRLDYCPQWDSYLWKRSLQGKNITLFSPHEVPDLYEAYYGKDRKLFEALYERYEDDVSLKFRQEVPASRLRDSWLVQSAETGRQYGFFADHVNTHTPFKEPIYQSNLCVEVTLPTKPIRNQHGEFDPITMTGQVKYLGLVQLCILAAYNLGNLNLNDPRDLEERADVAVTFLNELIDQQDYVVPQSYSATMQYRPLGIGIINFAYFLAKRGLKYGDQAARDLTHVLSEQMYYYGLKASMRYAQYKGKKLPAFDKLIYADGKNLLDTYNRRVDELTQQPLLCDWDWLTGQIAIHGVYNSTIGAWMPSESSSTVSNATSGFDKIRSLITSKSNKKISFKQVAPESVKLKNSYDMLWDGTAKDQDDTIKLAAVGQKFLCQSHSLNISYNPEHYTGGQVPLEVMINHTTTCVKYGVKTRYYMNTKGESANKVETLLAEAEPDHPLRRATDVETDDSGCASGACAI